MLPSLANNRTTDEELSMGGGESSAVSRIGQSLGVFW